jgi:hypothetical protein
MIANHIHDALAQVRTLQAFIIERNLFKGYSGKARLVAGLVALAGALVLASPWIPRSPWVHLAGWGAVLAIGVMANYGALVYWFLFDASVRRNPLMLKPAMDAIPALGVGGVLSLALVLHREFDLLFGVWMGLYGLAQVAYRNSLPKGIYLIGIFYLACGAACLLLPGIVFTNPWPMGAVFFCGETAGGLVLVCDHRRTVASAEAHHERD